MAQKPYAAMQSLLRDQSAAAQAMREAAISIKNASDMMAITLGQNVTEYGPSVQGNGGDPNGGRPRMPEKQTFRPVHTVVPPHPKARGLTGLRRRVADQLHQNFGHKSGSTFDAIYDRDNNHIGYRETRTDGSRVTRNLSDPELAEDLAAAGKRAGVSRVVGGFSNGGLLAGTRAIPYAGAALTAAEAVHEGFVRFGKERQANAQYQSIYGGSNLEGMGQRFQGEGFKLGQQFSGGLTGPQSDEAFKGVSALGFRGPQRSSDLNFISANYKSLGVGVSQSLELISTASKNLNTNLSGLKDSLKSVSAAAKETGQNAGAARAVFSSNYANISGAVPGVAAAPISSALSTMQTSMGRSMQGLDFSSAFTSLGGQAQLAPLAAGANGQHGLTISQFRSQELTNPSGSLQAFDTLMAQIAAPFLTSDVQNAINQAVSNVPGGKDAIAANPDLVGQLVTPKILNIVNADAVAAAYGRIQSLQGIDPVRAVTLLIMQYLGLAGNTSAQYQKQQQGKQQDYSKFLNKVMGGGSKGLNPVVDDALSTLKGKNVVVNTSKGQQVVSIQTAAKNYTDQVAKGTAIVADTGQSIKDALGGEAETNYKGPDTSGKTPDSSLLKSIPYSEYQKLINQGGGKTTGQVVITPSKELQQLLSFQATGNVSIANTGASLGVPPAPGG
jgi:hypothetical protein